MIELVSAIGQDNIPAKRFIRLIDLTSYAESIHCFRERKDNLNRRFEQIYRNKLHKFSLIFDAREKLDMITSDVDLISPGFHMIYQITNDDNLVSSIFTIIRMNLQLIKKN